ncbi:MAG: hypothetical protein AAGB51_03455 [Planctomycetota bacterium]
MDSVWDFFTAYPWVAVVAIVFTYTSVKAVAKAVALTNASKQTELTKREIAAYVAEGSMTPEQAERLIAADSKKKMDFSDC